MLEVTQPQPGKHFSISSVCVCSFTRPQSTSYGKLATRKWPEEDTQMGRGARILSWSRSPTRAESSLPANCPASLCLQKGLCQLVLPLVPERTHLDNI